MKYTAANLVESVRESFLLAVHTHDYKHGAFKKVITENLSAIEMTNVLLASSLLTESVKATLSVVRDLLTDYENGKWAKLSDEEILMKTVPIRDFCYIFEEDMKKRGCYVPPMLVQASDRTGNITSTHTIDTAGNGKSMPGGALRVVPGAPADFNAANVKHMADMGLEPKGKKNRQANTTEQKAGDESKDADKAKFGTAFEKNMRNAFC